MGVGSAITPGFARCNPFASALVGQSASGRQAMRRSRSVYDTPTHLWSLGTRPWVLYFEDIGGASVQSAMAESGGVRAPRRAFGRLWVGLYGMRLRGRSGVHVAPDEPMLHLVVVRLLMSIDLGGADQEPRRIGTGLKGDELELRFGDVQRSGELGEGRRPDDFARRPNAADLRRHRSAGEQAAENEKIRRVRAERRCLALCVPMTS